MSPDQDNTRWPLGWVAGQLVLLNFVVILRIVEDSSAIHHHARQMRGRLA